MEFYNMWQTVWIYPDNMNEIDSLGGGGSLIIMLPFLLIATDDNYFLYVY